MGGNYSKQYLEISQVRVLVPTKINNYYYAKISNLKKLDIHNNYGMASIISYSHLSMYILV